MRVKNPAFIQLLFLVYKFSVCSKDRNFSGGICREEKLEAGSLLLSSISTSGGKALIWLIYLISLVLIPQNLRTRYEVYLGLSSQISSTDKGIFKSYQATFESTYKASTDDMTRSPTRMQKECTNIEYLHAKLKSSMSSIVKS